MKTLLKIVVTIAVVIVLLLGGLFAFIKCTYPGIGDAVIGQVASGDLSLLDTARKALNGELTASDAVDAVVESAKRGVDTKTIAKSVLGIDDEAWEAIESAGAAKGIDVNDSAALAEKLEDDPGALDAIKDLADQVQSGEVDAPDAAGRLEGILGGIQG